MNDTQAAMPLIGEATTPADQRPNSATRRAEMTGTPEGYVGAPAGQQGIEALSPAPVLITEQEVAFGTAAAVRARPTTMRRCIDATPVVVSAIHRMFTTGAADARRARRDYPKHYVFLEHACMAREMDRL
jgi:hypothetical protein